MNVPVRLGLFGVAVTVAFAAAFGFGSVIDPVAEENRAVELAAADGGHGGMSMGRQGATPAVPAAPGTGAGAAVETAQLPGLASSARGYTLRLENTAPGAGEAVPVAFRIESPDGGAVSNYRLTHEKEMHLIVVRRDFSGFQHLHPERDGAGVWSVPVNLAAAGVYRIFADFAPAVLGEPLTLGADLFVPGEFRPAEPVAPSDGWSADGYEVKLAGSPVAGAESELAFTVTRSGAAVQDLEPYLAAFGHLVSLRSGDLAYLHTHPVQEAVAGQRGGPEIRFGTTFPTAGRYRLYLNFAHAGVVRTAEFAVDVPATAGIAAPPPAAPAPAAPTEPAPAQPPAPVPGAPQPQPQTGGAHGGH